MIVSSKTTRRARSSKKETTTRLVFLTGASQAVSTETLTVCHRSKEPSKGLRVCKRLTRSGVSMETSLDSHRKKLLQICLCCLQRPFRFLPLWTASPDFASPSSWTTHSLQTSILQRSHCQSSTGPRAWRIDDLSHPTQPIAL